MGTRTGIRLGRLFGVEIALDWSLLIVFTLVLFNVALGVLPAWHPDWSAALTWTIAAASAILLFVSVLLHELAHALVAQRRGVPVDRITLFVFGGIAHMRAEPRRARDELWIALAGPLTSLVLGAGALAIGVAAAPAMGDATDPEAAARFVEGLAPLPTVLLWLGQVNVVLALFNLAPGFPLDGGRVLRAILWALTDDFARATRWAANAGRAFAFLLLAIGVYAIFRGAIVAGLWLSFIGWFLNNAALLSHRDVMARRALEGLTARDVMNARLEVVDPTLSVDALVRDHLMAKEERAFPVVDAEGHLQGLVCLEDIRGLPRARWPEIPVRDIMTPVRALVALAPTDPAERALRLLAESGHDQLPVVENRRVHGLVQRRALIRWIALGGDEASAEQRRAPTARPAFGTR